MSCAVTPFASSYATFFSFLVADLGLLAGLRILLVRLALLSLFLNLPFLFLAYLRFLNFVDQIVVDMLIPALFTSNFLVPPVIVFILRKTAVEVDV